MLTVGTIVIERRLVGGAMDYVKRQDLVSNAQGDNLMLASKNAVEAVLAKLGEDYMLLGSSFLSGGDNNGKTVRVMVQHKQLAGGANTPMPAKATFVNRPPRR